ncbi:unnamed protein product [Ectocarpus sp. 4 AP-2014]|uniref:EsV-1-160 n=1 Tax=Ectocarpus siliculosus virus 1 (isolate New Zealand/Kaikoura/1988) TaxID=654926 RepID=Q8QNC2_ESV1K|nr:EsV-1-160 [Ectocarpus siliculosus virus 1]AAK14574.1 EsV-1-160 [Ectocarpus siliculosus virus 1]
MTTVTWTKTGTQYEVSSKQHLLQIMHKGALYTDLGDPPAEYWSESYLQTTDIDLIDDHENITPIGVSIGSITSDSFQGEYDGGCHAISNWSFASGTDTYFAGLFATVSGTLKHVRLDGVWTLSGSAKYNGFLCGYSTSTATILDIEADFSTGTILEFSGEITGVLFGRARGDVYGVTLRGSIYCTGSSTTCAGGVCGYGYYSSMTMIRNLAIFPNGISGLSVGGIAGSAHRTSLTRCVNAMIGDMHGTYRCGGIIGDGSQMSKDCKNVVNSMTGNITGDLSAGGVMGRFATYNSSSDFTEWMNYMSGNITSMTLSCGGIIGTAVDHDTATYYPSLSNSLVAMNGSVDHAVVGDGDTLPLVGVLVDTSFGMTYTSHDYPSDTPLEGYTTDTVFTALPYIPLSGTDSDGTVYEWDFIFANLAGNASYADYTHLSLHTGDVQAPFYADLDLPDNNAMTYLAYANIDNNSLFVDSSLGVNASTASIVYNHSKSEILFGGAFPSTTLTWVKSGAQYEVSTKEHLLQLMHQGLLYVNGNDPPTDYWSASYLQTADIDLIDDHEHITPIGVSTENPFSGDYDGGSYKISNWCSTEASDRTGLFGEVVGGSLKHLRLGGVWTSSGASSYRGFVCGKLDSAVVRDVEGDFAEGTAITNSATHTGTLFGYVNDSEVYGATVRGSVEIEESTNGRTGGVVGHAVGTDVTMCRNVATFTKGITGDSAGGVIGFNDACNLSCLINAMQGNIVGSFAGGVCGQIFSGTNADCVVNSMTGNIEGTSTAGGIVGRVFTRDDNLVFTKLANHMHGDVTSTVAAGGVFGQLSRFSGLTGDISASNSIVAMNGAVEQAVRGTEDFTPSAIDAVVDTGFGMTHAGGDDYASSNTALEGYTTDPSFTELSYFPLVGTDPDGTTYSWDFVFANIGGNASYSDYTHLSLHTGQVSAPLFADFGLSETNTQVYATYAHLGDKALFTDESFTVHDSSADVVFDYSKSTVLFGTAPALICDPRALNIKVLLSSLVDVGAVNKLTYQESGTLNEVVAHENFTDTSKIVSGLKAETTYTIRLYTAAGLGLEYTLLGQDDCTTYANLAKNYDVADFVSASGAYDISDLDDSVSSAMNDLFSTGASVEVAINDSKKSRKTTFVKRGGVISVANEEALLLPFDSSSGATQSATITLSDDTSVTVDFDDQSGSVEIGGVSFTHGQSLILDGKKVTVVDI